MAKKISVEWLGQELAETITRYTEEVSAAIDKEVERTAKMVQTEIKAKSPVRKGPKGGTYQRGWTRKKNTQGGSTTYTIYNKNKGFIAHLLENGWTSRSGKRVPGKPHIKPAFDNHAPQMVRNIEQIIKDGG